MGQPSHDNPRTDSRVLRLQPDRSSQPAHSEVASPVTVVVEGVNDERTIERIEIAASAAIRESNPGGAWVVAIAPSEQRGRWDVAMKGPAIRHVFSLLATEGTLPDVIGDHLRRAVTRMRHPS